jgi:outer membrane protein assembly factor BamB
MLIGSYDTHLYAFDAKTGAVKWKLATEGPVHSTASVQNGTVYLGSCDERFRGIRLSDGRVLFTIPVSYTAASTVMDGTHAYVGTFDNEMLAIDVLAKKILWRFKDPQREFPYYSSAALAGTRVIVGNRDKSVHAIDTATGKEAWKFTTRARVDSSPAIAAGRVFVGSSDGRLYVLDAQTGRKLWDYDVGDALTASPAIASGRVVIGAQDGKLYCFG